MKTTWSEMRHSFMLLLFCMLCCACTGNNTQATDGAADEAKKHMLQGVWANEYDGSVLFTIKGDSISFNDSISETARYHIANDTLQIEYTHPVNYCIKRMTENAFVFVNSNGDEISLVKRNDIKPVLKDQRPVNQNKIVKHDTIINVAGKKFHAYVQVNPTSYKVVRKSVNEEGIDVETTYFDNIIHIALYDGGKKLYGHNIVKTDFKKQVPQSFIKQAIMTDIEVIGAINGNSVRFNAILTIPDSSTDYIVHIDIDENGGIKLSM